MPPSQAEHTAVKLPESVTLAGATLAENGLQVMLSSGQQCRAAQAPTVQEMSTGS